MIKSNNGLVWWNSILSGLSYLAGAAILADVVGDKWAALFFVIVGALNQATAAYVAAVKPVETPGTGPYRP